MWIKPRLTRKTICTAAVGTHRRRVCTSPG